MLKAEFAKVAKLLECRKSPRLYVAYLADLTISISIKIPHTSAHTHTHTVELSFDRASMRKGGKEATFALALLNVVSAIK